MIFARAIEIAYYKYTKDLEDEPGQRFAIALDSLDVAVIITDAMKNNFMIKWLRHLRVH